VEADPFPVDDVPRPATEEDWSIPPIGDLTVEPAAAKFFSSYPPVEEATVHEEEMPRSRMPHVVERRRRFAVYVRCAVAVAGVVCVVAVARTATTPRADEVARSTASASFKPSEEVSPVANQDVPTPRHASATEIAEPEVAVPPQPASSEVVPTTAAPLHVETARAPSQEKADARRSLERGNVRAAIAAGERAVALDASDADAWLVLGAAYQELGNVTHARRCYALCAKSATRGPVAECRALLR
jgi:hypothetical protein